MKIVNPNVDICLICGRPIPAKCGSLHHLVPKVKGGTNGLSIYIHNICHSKIHSLFTEKELKNQKNNVFAILENEEMKKFVKWLRTKPLNFDDPSKLSNNRRK